MKQKVKIERQICAYCGHKFYPTEEDIEKIGHIEFYYCVNCGELTNNNLEIKNYETHCKSEWN